MARKDANPGQSEKAATRKIEALNLRIAGYRFQDIADQMGISISTAYSYVKASLEEVAEERKNLAHNLRDLELARLDAMTARLWSRMIEVKKKRPDEDKHILQVQLQIIDRIHKLSVRRSRLLGLDAPTRVTQGLYIGDLESKTDDELDRIIEAGDTVGPGG